MNDKPLSPGSQPSVIPNRPDTQWVMVFTLLTKSGKEEAKKPFKVKKKRLVIGSALSSDIRIQQNSVSNVHAVVEMDDQGITHIYDMASETGVFVNDQKRVNAELRDEDEIKIGFATLVFKRVAVADAQKSAPAGSVRTTGSGRKLFYDAQEDFRPLILEDERNVIQIFDFPASSEQALQVVMYWGDVILNVMHVSDQETVTLGETRKATFLVPGVHNEFPLVSFEGSTVALQFSGDMTGVVRTGKELVQIADLPGSRFHLCELFAPAAAPPAPAGARARSLLHPHLVHLAGFDGRPRGASCRDQPAQEAGYRGAPSAGGKYHFQAGGASEAAAGAGEAASETAGAREEGGAAEKAASAPASSEKTAASSQGAAEEA
jgi:pSer/pThr/pTyr-binding forkhead associated (FHA) protein